MLSRFSTFCSSEADLKGALKAANDGIKSKMCSFWEDRGFCAKGRGVHAFPTCDSNFLGYFSCSSPCWTPAHSLSLCLCVAPKLLSGFRINFLAVCSWMVGYFQVPQVHEASAAVPCCHTMTYGTSFSEDAFSFSPTLGSLTIAHLFSLAQLHVLVSFRLQTSSTCSPGLPVVGR